MKNAYEYKEEFSPEGKRLKRELNVGPIVPWTIVALTALITGKAIASIPSSFWEFFKR